MARLMIILIDDETEEHWEFTHILTSQVKKFRKFFTDLLTKAAEGYDIGILHHVITRRKSD